MKIPRTAQLAAGVVVAVLVWLVVYPVLLVTRDAFVGPAGGTLDHVRAFLARPNEWQAFWGSLWLSVATVVLSALIGVPLAFLFSRYEFPGRRVLGALVALPVALPPLVGVVAFLFLYGETGFVAHLYDAVTGAAMAPWRLEGPGAILLVQAYSMYVYFYLLTRAALERLDGSAGEAASSLGASRWGTLTRVTLPLLRPALVGAALLTFTAALASFSAPYIFGGGYRVLPTQILATRLNGDYALSMVETVALTLLALVALGLSTRVGPDAATTGGKGAAPARAIGGRTGILVSMLGWGLAVFLLLPHATLLLLSFVPLATWTTQALPPVYSVANYVMVAHEPTRLLPLLNSLWMAVAATVLSVGIAVLSGVLIVRRRVRGRGLIETLLATPWAVPGTVFALALATAFRVREPWAARMMLVGTIWYLQLAYLIRDLPVTSRPVLTGFRQLDPTLDDAAAALGADRWTTWRRVILPLLRPAIAAGAALAFVVALGDFVTSILLYTYDSRPMSLEILSSLRDGDVGVAAVYGVVLMLASATVFLLGSERSATR